VQCSATPYQSWQWGTGGGSTVIEWRCGAATYLGSGAAIDSYPALRRGRYGQQLVAMCLMLMHCAARVTVVSRSWCMHVGLASRCTEPDDAINKVDN